MKTPKQRPTLFWQIFPGYVLLALLILIMSSGWVLFSFKQSQTKSLELLLSSHLLVLQSELLPLLDITEKSQSTSVLKKSAQATGARFTVYKHDGSIWIDSETNPSFDDIIRRPEFSSALELIKNQKSSHSFVILNETLYALASLNNKSKVVGVLVGSLPLSQLNFDRRSLVFQIALGSLFILGMAVLISFYLMRHWMEPVTQIKSIAEQMERGDFSARMRVGPGASIELKTLSIAMNKVCQELSERIQVVNRQKQEQEEVFSSMVEGVIFLDQHLKIVQINASTQSIFNLPATSVKGMSVFEVFRSPDLFELIERTRQSSHAIESEFDLKGGGEDDIRSLHAHGSTLTDENGQPRGHLFVINDVTKLKRLESHRRDFVSNVSHELKTPLTAIQGFVETLLEIKSHTPEVKSQLEVIRRQSSRLGAIIDDLLALSRIEAEGDTHGIELASGKVSQVLHAAAESCSLRAKEKQIEIKVDCPPQLTALLNAPLLEQAIVNLIDNAIKYSESSRFIEVRAKKEASPGKAGSVVIQVADQGVGIAKEHLPRIFERFYRVDKARSRKLGGTGLGLAIVKHIALAHNGGVMVHSEIGKGSIFSIKIDAT